MSGAASVWTCLLYAAGVPSAQGLFVALPASLPMAWGVGELPAINATLNGAATLLLVAGLVAIKRRRESMHRWLMLGAFGVSVAFLVCYLVYHSQVGSRPFGGHGPVRGLYFAILVSHIVLAATVPILAMASIYFGWRDRRAAHRRVVRWTFPIWLYVSVTGVVIYVMLYHLYPPNAEKTIISGVSPAVVESRVANGQGAAATSVSGRRQLLRNESHHEGS